MALTINYPVRLDSYRVVIAALFDASLLNSESRQRGSFFAQRCDLWGHRLGPYPVTASSDLLFATALAPHLFFF